MTFSRSSLLRTAACAALFVASASGAHAQLEVNFTGGNPFCAQNEPSDDFGDFQAESNIVIRYSGVADNGLEYGGQVEIIGDNGGGFGADDWNPCPIDKVDINYTWRDFGFDVHALTLGFEKTFLDGRASIELRLPYFKDPFDSSFGDLSIIGKYAFAHDVDSVVSAGIELTLPTSEFSDEMTFEPFVGWSWAHGKNWLLQGYHSVSIIPGETFDPVISTDLTASYVIGMQTGWLKAIVPQVGLHYNWPTGLAGGDHELNASVGAHFILERGLTATLAIGFPLADLKPYDARIGAGLQWNFGAPPPPPPPP